MAVRHGFVWLGCFPTGTGLSRPGAGTLVPALGFWLEESSHLTRWRGRIRLADQTGQFGDPLGQGQDREDGGLWTMLHEGAGIRLGKNGAELLENRITG